METGVRDDVGYMNNHNTEREVLSERWRQMIGCETPAGGRGVQPKQREENVCCSNCTPTYTSIHERGVEAYALAHFL